MAKTALHIVFYLSINAARIEPCVCSVFIPTPVFLSLVSLLVLGAVSGGDNVSDLSYPDPFG